jgi:hypothetical protein
MTHNRTVTGTIHRPSSEPWAGFIIAFTLTPSATTAHATLPYGTIRTVTGPDGTFTAELEVNATYEVTLEGALDRRGSSTTYPAGTQFSIVVPEGDTPISLETLRAGAISPQVDATLTNAVAQIESEIDAHVVDHANPHVVTAAQLSDLDSEVSASADVAANTAARHTHANKATLDNVTAAYTTAEQSKLSGIATGATANATDAQLRDRATHTGAQAIATVTGLQTALDSKALDADLTAHESDTANPHAVTAAQTGAYTTAQTDSALALRQPLDSDLTAIAALVAANDDVLQRKAGSWTNRTPAQLKTDLALGKGDVGLGNVDNTSDASKPISTATQNALNLKRDNAGLGDIVTHAVAEFATAVQGGKADTAVQPATLASHTGNTSNPHSVTKTQVGLDNVTNDAQVTLATDQTVTGHKTFRPSDYQPAFGANLSPALASWTLTGTATYSAPNIVITSGAGSMSTNIAVTSGTLYQIEVTASPSSGGNLTISLGAATDTCASWQRVVALVAPSTGTLAVTISGATWAATITAIVVRAVTRAAASLVAGAGEVRAWGTHTAVGTYAQQSLTTGYYDTAVGTSAQQSLTTGYYDTAVGTYAQQNLTTGYSDTAVGAYAQQNLTTGYSDTAVGTYAQRNLTTGYYDTAVGAYAQQNLTTGYYDTAVGAYAQQNLTTGYYDTAVGTSAQQSLTTGNSDTAVGASAQYAPLGNSAYATTTASYQTSVGMESGQSSASQVDGITTIGYRSAAGAANATALGREARADHSGSVAIGYQAVTTAPDQVEVGARHVEYVEITDPGAGATNSARLYARDNGSGKTQLCVVFASGAVQVLATQP